MRLGLFMLIPAVAVAGLAGCRGDRSDAPPRQFLPGMDDQPRWSAQGQSEFFEDGRMQRPNVPGTIAFGRSSELPIEGEQPADWVEHVNSIRSDLLREDDAIYRGVDTNGNPLQTMPVEVTLDMLEHGQERFNIYCAVCHGYLGDGNGTVGGKWSYALPTFHDDKYKPGGELGQDGHIWDIALNGLYDAQGVQKMPGYSHALSERDAWAVVAYIRALQRSQDATMDDLTEVERSDMQRIGATDATGQTIAQGGES
ncbi:MAG: cytochrome c [Planctomycetota bacterium]